MSASKVRSQERMFHIQFPARREFWTWTELGCLSRSLGFPTELIRHNLTEEVESEEDGMYLEQLQRVIELKLLNQALHRSFNMHTSDWNLCVVKKAVKLLNLSVLSFEEVHNIRIAYVTYEAGDMKGLHLDQRTLLRTLKMCHRVISPKKLMHRVKHMKGRLEEANRIQLYEFFDLILWCDDIEQHQEVPTMGEAEGKEKDLYNLVDFHSLLSHQDQRRSRALDKRYLAEEWDFGREQLGNRHMFRGEVVYTDQRIKQTRTQKKNYRGLKRAVGQSQRRVYRATAGSIRHRPISAPDLSMYSTPRDTPRARTTSAAAMYQSVQRRLHSAASSGGLHSRVDLPERPTLPEYVRAHTPCVVTSDELDDVQLKMQMLQFDIVTLETRCQVKKKEEMNFYIPEYEPAGVEDVNVRVAGRSRRKADHWTSNIVEKLAYPPYHLPAHHAHTCDARFRGWKPAEHKGRQKILTSPTFDNSPHGQLLAKQRTAMLAPVSNLHKHYVLRYTSRQEAAEQQMDKRPCTAPASSPRSKPLKRLGCRSAGHYFRRGEETPLASKTAHEIQEENPHTDDSKAEECAKTVKSYPDPFGKYTQEHSNRSSQSKEGDVPTGEDSSTQESCPGMVNGPTPGRNLGSVGESAPSRVCDVNSAARMEDKGPLQVSGKTGPSRRLGGPKVVDVGLIGTITLLESIQEHETEDKPSSTLSSSSSCSSCSSCFSSTHPSPNQAPKTSKDPGQLQENLDQTSKSIPAGWSRRPDSSEERTERVASNVNSLQDEDGQKMENGVAATFCPDVKDVSSVPRIAEPGSQKQKERLTQSFGVAGGQSKQGHTQPSNQKSGQTSGTRGGLTSRTEARTELRKARVNSAASSTKSEASDHREALTPLTSVTVTIKNKNQQVTTNTRVNNDVNNQADVTAGNPPSPLGFKRSPPCVTSTPRRKKSTPPTNPPGDKQNGYRNPNMLINTPANCSTNPNQSNDPVLVQRPDSADTGLRKKNVNLLNAETDSNSHLNWVQDQILAMNSACQNNPQGEKVEKENDGEVKEVLDEGLPMNNEGEEDEEKKKTTIRFTKEQILQDKRDSAKRKSLLNRRASEGALKLKNYDLNAAMARRFTFNKATTRRLIERVEDVISPELRSRIKSGNMGLKVV